MASIQPMTPAQRREAVKALLDNVEERTFTRGAWAVTIDEAGIVTIGGKAALRVAFTLRRNGHVVLQDEWVAIGAPPVWIYDGEEANPDHDPEDPTSQPTRRKFRQDVRAAFRGHFLDVMQGIVARRAGL